MNEEGKKYVGLIFGCPHQINAEDCPLKELQEIPLEKRLKFWNYLTIEGIHEIIEHHIVCRDNYLASLNRPTKP